MKVSKRSLIMSIAVLCVCALSLTAASFAWFTNSQTAKVDTLTMDVEARTTLQIRVKGSSDETWKTVLNANDFITGGVYHNAAILNDASTDSSFTTWVTADYTEDGEIFFETGKASYITNTQADGNYLKLPIEFRCTSVADDVSVIATNATVATTGKVALNKAVRMGYNNQIFAFETDSEATYQPATGEEAAVTFGTLANSVVAELGDSQADGYRYGEATIYVWIEGSDSACNDGNTPAEITAGISFGLSEVTNS